MHKHPKIFVESVDSTEADFHERALRHTCAQTEPASLTASQQRRSAARGRPARERAAEHRTQACSSGPRLTLVDAGQPAPREGLPEPVALHMPRVHPPPRPIPNLPRELARRPRRHTRDEQRRSATHIGLDQAVSAGCGDQPLEVLLVLCATTSLAIREECNPDGSDRQLTPTPLAM